MFEAAEVPQKISDAEFDAALDELRVDLINAQYDLREADFPVIILLEGDDRPACAQMLKGMHVYMDQRYIESHALSRPTEEERERPPFYRYWRRLPPHGRIGAFVGGWVVNLIADTWEGRLDDAGTQRSIAHVRRFEEALVEDGALLLKYWFHLSKKGRRKLFKKAKKKPDQHWWLTKEERRIHEHIDELLPIAERVLRETSTGDAPWNVIASDDANYCGLAFARSIHQSITARLSASKAETRPPGVPTTQRVRTVLDEVDLSQSLNREEYRERRKSCYAEISRLTREAHKKGVSSVLAFEGWDAAGKGGVIRRLTEPIDVRLLQVVPIAAPTDEERAHHYLWRFWRHLPAAGRVRIFDRSWYGRVLVERIEGFASESEWRRAYAEISDFEAQLAESGVLVQKFWLHIDPDEQLRRFEARAQTAYKKHKLTEDDYRNRDKWPDYVTAVDEMVARTSREGARWHLVPANDKLFARIHVLETYAKGLADRL